ncbi:MAG: hypothetical protein FJ118_00150 [Deltaproteobacteria bacterium]|nr:hypothetical protein [Deltaproteobacteria bacterium]
MKDPSITAHGPKIGLPDAGSLAVQIIPDLTIDEKYASIIQDAQARIKSFADNALRNQRLPELFTLQKTSLTASLAEKVLRAPGRMGTAFQFEAQAQGMEGNFRCFVWKTLEDGAKFKFYLAPGVHEILLQLISLEDRRTIAIFSMLSSSLDVGYRILTTLYGNQLQRMLNRAPSLIWDELKAKLERLLLAKPSEELDPWGEEHPTGPAARERQTKDGRRGSEDNILSVIADEDTFSEISHYVEHIVSRGERIRQKREQLEANPQLSRSEMYRQMIAEDLHQLENCYARIHIYVKAFYKNKDKRSSTRNRILRQFFAAEIEAITGETGLLEDLLCLSQDEYFKNIDRHKGL